MGWDKGTDVKDWTQVLLNSASYLVGFHITSYLSERCLSWWLFTDEDTLWCLSWRIWIALTFNPGHGAWVLDQAYFFVSWSCSKILVISTPCAWPDNSGMLILFVTSSHEPEQRSCNNKTSFIMLVTPCKEQKYSYFKRIQDSFMV